MHSSESGEATSGLPICTEVMTHSVSATRTKSQGGAAPRQTEIRGMTGRVAGAVGVV